MFIYPYLINPSNPPSFPPLTLLSSPHPIPLFTLSIYMPLTICNQARLPQWTKTTPLLFSIQPTPLTLTPFTFFPHPTPLTTHPFTLSVTVLTITRRDSRSGQKRPCEQQSVGGRTVRARGPCTGRRATQGEG